MYTIFLMFFAHAPKDILPTSRGIMRRLKRMLKDDFRKAAVDRECNLLAPFLKPLAKVVSDGSTDRLRRLFRAQSERTGLFVGSKFVISSSGQLDRLKSGADHSPHRSGKIRDFSTRHEISASPFRIGFVQIIPRRSDNRYSMPILGLDDGVINRIPSQAKKRLLKSIQQIYTYGNHDYLHHFTSDTLNPVIAEPAFEGQLAQRLAQAVNVMVDQFRAVGSTSPYEKWALKTHQWLFHEALGKEPLETSNTAFANQYKSIVENALQSLEQVAQSSDPHACTPGDFKYLGCLLLFGMARVLPINDPYMMKTIDRLSAMSGRALSCDEIRQSVAGLNPDLIDIVSGRPDVTANPKTVAQPTSELFATYFHAHYL